MLIFIRGNEVRNTGILGLMFGEPQLKVPQWPENLDEVLMRIANPPKIGESCRFGPETALRQTAVLAAVPDTMHCSAYTLAQLITVAARFRRLEYYPSRCPQPLRALDHTKHWLPEVLFKYEDISNSNIMDSGFTYGIRINFTAYWKALSETPTKWYQTPDEKTLVAVSAWGTTRMSQDAGSLLLEFAAPQSTSLDYELFGRSVLLPVEGMPHIEVTPDMFRRENPWAWKPTYPMKRFNEWSSSLLTLIWRGRVRKFFELEGSRWVLQMPARPFAYLKEHVAQLLLDLGMSRAEKYLTTPMDYSSSARRLSSDCAAIVESWIGTFTKFPVDVTSFFSSFLVNIHSEV